MDTYKHDQEQYMERMNQTALSKFDLLKPYLNPTIKVLDFGSGYSPDFIEAIVQTGTSYTACDSSPIVQEKLRTNGINLLSEEELLLSKERFDIVFLSSVFHAVWGLGSLERESKETYDVTDAIGSLSLAYGLTLVSYHAEYDESYIEHLKKYFSIRNLPFATKGIWIFKK